MKSGRAVRYRISVKVNLPESGTDFLDAASLRELPRSKAAFFGLRERCTWRRPSRHNPADLTYY